MLGGNCAESLNCHARQRGGTNAKYLQLPVACMQSILEVLVLTRLKATIHGPIVYEKTPKKTHNILGLGILRREKSHILRKIARLQGVNDGNNNCIPK